MSRSRIPSVAHPGTPVVHLHGLWMGPWCMAYWHRQFIKRGYVSHRFGYASVKRSIDHAIDSLVQELVRLNESGDKVTPVVIGHSLGGLVAMHAVAKLPRHCRGMLIFLGTPLHGSNSARQLERIPGGGKLLGHAAEKLSGKPDHLIHEGWRYHMIAGTRKLGLGLLMGGGREPGDGTVFLRETRAEFIDQHVALPVTHSSMLFSRRCVDTASGMIEDGMKEQQHHA